MNTTNRHKSVARILHDAQLAIDNTLSLPVIQERVGIYGFDSDRMQAGKLLYEAAVAAVRVRKEAYGAQKHQTAILKEREKEAFGAYQALAQVARAIYGRNSGNLTALGLDRRMPHSRAGFIGAGFMLFDNAGFNADLAGFGYSPERLAAERAKVDAYSEASLKQEAAKGASQHATQVQDKALRALMEWVAQYLKSPVWP